MMAIAARDDAEPGPLASPSVICGPDSVFDSNAAFSSLWTKTYRFASGSGSRGTRSLNPSPSSPPARVRVSHRPGRCRSRTAAFARVCAGPRHWLYPLAPDATRDKVESFLGDPKRSAQLMLNIDAMGRLLRNCRILHDEATGRNLIRDSLSC
jgi:hypothetical protein